MKALGAQNDITLVYWRRTENYVWGNGEVLFKNKEIYIPANSGKPLKRIIPTLKYARKALTELKKIKPDCIYVQGLDMLLIAVFYKRHFYQNLAVVYEIADLHRLIIQPSNNVFKKLVQRVLRSLERSLCKEIAFLVVTSQQYYNKYYGQFIPTDKYLYIANAPEKEVFSSYHKKDGGAFTIGFVGAAHFTEQIKLLASAGKESGIQIIIAGSFLDNKLQEYCERKGAICSGTYNYERDIVNLYSKIDCVFSVYPMEDANVNLALPNKLYESIVCGLPIIVAKGTYLSEIVEKYKVGISIDSNNIAEYIEAFKNLRDNKEHYQDIVKNCNAIREECFVEKYNQLLIDKISDLKTRIATEN